MISGDLFHEFDVRELGAYLKEIRESKGLSQETAAELGNVSVAWVQNIEHYYSMNGTPSYIRLKSYCLGLGIDIELKYNFRIEEERNEE